MSCYNWESGEIKLSVKEWTRFKRDFREGYNKLQNAELVAATEHWDRYKTGPVPDLWRDHDFAIARQRFYMLWRRWKPSIKTPEDIVRNLGSWEERQLPRKPIRKDFPLATNKQTVFNFDEATIQFDNDTRTVSYYSGDNNRQVEEARNHKVGRLFFRLLGQVQWTRGTGGKFIGNDEYNQDRNGEGEGGNYVTAEYGPNVNRGRYRFSTV